VSTHYFASSLLVVNDGARWRGSSLELGVQADAATFREALDAVMTLVAGNLGNTPQSSRSSDEWELFHYALKEGVPCGIADPVTALAACVAVPTLFVLQNRDGERVEWKGHCHGAHALTRRP
jgi:hypothetical protein